MVLNRKSKQQRKQRRGTKRFAAGCGVRKSKQSGVLQRGGVSPSCVFDGASGSDLLYRNSGANIHNTNPQASLDLDNKFMNYGGAVPLGSNILQGGAAKCGDEGLGGTGNGKDATFKQYLNGLENQYMIGAGLDNGPSYMNTTTPTTSMTTTPSMNTSDMGTNSSMAPMNTGAMGPANKSDMAPASINGMAPVNTTTTPPMSTSAMNNSGMKGGGFSTDPSEYIAGLPVYKAYDDCCPPAIISNKLVMGSPDQRVCGLGAIRGGARRRRSHASRKHKHLSKHSSNNKSRRTAKRKNHNSRNSHRQRGGAVGDFVYSTKSTPAPMGDAFIGPLGVFRYPDDMKSRAFDEVQPNYSVNAI